MNEDEHLEPTELPTQEASRESCDERGQELERREPSMGTAEESSVTWTTVKGALTRPYRVTAPMVLLVSYALVYLVIAEGVRPGSVHAPEVALDRILPLFPVWALVYGALYLFLILLPVFVIQQEDAIDRTVWAYLTVWTLSFVCFLLYPTVAPRPDEVTGSGFGAWGLRFLYDADPPYNCFPSIHVAHSFVSALSCHCVNRALGRFAISCASLVALSTLFIKQHYVADVIAGTLLALVAYAIFLRGSVRANTPESDRRLAPVLALFVVGIVGNVVAVYWVLFRLWAWI